MEFDICYSGFSIGVANVGHFPLRK
jgi:hypothetical protein